MIALTRKQKQFYDMLVRFYDANGYCPTFTQMAGEMNLRSLGTVAKYVSELERRGAIRRKPGKYCSITFLKRKSFAANFS